MMRKIVPDVVDHKRAWLSECVSHACELVAKMPMQANPGALGLESITGPVLKAPLPIGEERRTLSQHFYRCAALARVGKQRTAEEPCDGDKTRKGSARFGVSVRRRFCETRGNIHQVGRRLYAGTPHMPTIALVQLSP